MSEPITLTDQAATALRDALRAERLAEEALELAGLKARLVLHEARTVRAALLDDLADEYGFDATTPHDFDYAARTLTKKG